MHKHGFVEAELKKIADDYLHNAVDQRYFNMLVAEALLILLKRREPHEERK